MESASAVFRSRVIAAGITVAAVEETLAESNAPILDTETASQLASRAFDDVRVVEVRYSSVFSVVGVSPELVERLLQDASNVGGVVLGLGVLYGLARAVLSKLRRGQVSEKRLVTILDESQDEWEVHFPWGKQDLLIKGRRITRRSKTRRVQDRELLDVATSDQSPTDERSIRRIAQHSASGAAETKDAPALLHHKSRRKHKRRKG